MGILRMKDFFYGEESLYQVIHVVVWLIEEAVSQTCTYQNANKTIKEQRFKIFLFQFLVFIESVYDDIGQC
jgi:hypothetical protein